MLPGTLSQWSISEPPLRGDFRILTKMLPFFHIILKKAKLSEPEVFDILSRTHMDSYVVAGKFKEIMASHVNIVNSSGSIPKHGNERQRSQITSLAKFRQGP